MKLIIFIVLIAIAVILFGTVPLYILGIVFNALATAFKWLAKTLDFFGFGGSLNLGVV